MAAIDHSAPILDTSTRLAYDRTACLRKYHDVVLGTVQQVMSIRELRARYPAVRSSLAAVLGGLISIVGIIALLAVSFSNSQSMR